MRETNGQVDRETDRQTDRQIATPDRQRDRQTEGGLGRRGRETGCVFCLPKIRILRPRKGGEGRQAIKS